ncbi:CPBP family intramembrane metalloprotease [Spiractinospora alimapuensis]|uniref:CPBP family intramembrane glutamic endopeptidase n=1 Tax=Spiractinospora alimapuensis TaxID=2820884 RepID=UPI001F39FAC1|nr:type II CAAX endopeptidase family protein [Spiractinospora alimapuensis]QVQ50209.1 CPBP family intramembrane metalloprotease [Spiractinospora alimapuensis]
MRSTDTVSEPPTTTARLPLREIVAFVLLAYGLAWLVYLPAVSGGAGPEDPIYGISASLYMFTPGVAALLITYFLWKPRSGLRALGIVPLRPIRRVGGYSLLALVVLPIVGAVAPWVAAAFGVIKLDLTTFSGFRAALEERAPAVVPYLPDAGFPLVGLLVAVGFVAATILPMVLLTCLGEEIGWRGYLLPRLLPLGVWPALVVSGVVHAFWHSPQLFLQIRSGSMDAGVIVVYVLGVTVLGLVIGWLRLASGSVWPATIAHAANNSFAILGFLLVSDADTPTSAVLYSGNTGGVIGIAVTLALVVPLALTGQLRVRSFDPVLEHATVRKP